MNFGLQVWLTNLSAANGTVVDGRTVHEESIYLSHGSVFKIADRKFRFEYGTHETQACVLMVPSKILTKLMRLPRTEGSFKSQATPAVTVRSMCMRLSADAT